MNTNQFSIRQNRLPSAAAAFLASAMVLSSVLWLFSGDVTPAAGDPAVAVQQHVASPRA